ncbi:MAG TPA: hypothetical protein VEL11_14870 [Candidatus Bathyarchaeia archaeon]|nr:hypothetical protein [Candidatus Bathyarchaeia archaeon]
MKWLDKFDIAAVIVPVLATVVIAAIVSVANLNIIQITDKSQSMNPASSLARSAHSSAD